MASLLLQQAALASFAARNPDGRLPSAAQCLAPSLKFMPLDSGSASSAPQRASVVSMLLRPQEESSCHLGPCRGFAGTVGNGAAGFGMQQHGWKARESSVSRSALNDDYEETEEEIQAGYEALYGKAFGQRQSTERKWEAVDDAEGDDPPAKVGRGRNTDRERPVGRREDRGGRGARGDFEERVVQIRRVTKVVQGGKQLSFRAVVVVGDKRGKVGVGVNKAKEVIIAVQKAVANAKRNMITVPINKYKTFPHRADGIYGAAHVMLRPASVGTGVIAGGAVRVVLELAGVENALGKQIGSENPLNNARAVVEAISSMKTFRQVSEDRGIPMEELWK